MRIKIAHHAADGGLKDILGRTDTGKHIWFAGKLPKDMQEMAGQAGFKPTDVAGFIHLSEIAKRPSPLDRGPAVERPLGYRGKLSREHQTQLAALLKIYGKVKWSRGDAPGIADGMSESIEISGPGALTKCNPNTLQRLLQQIILDGRKGGKVPK